jgi:hypothetical protein
MELRIDYINRLEQYWHSGFTALTMEDITKYKPFSDVQFAALYLMDFQQLKHFATGQSIDLNVFLQQLQVIPSLTKLSKLPAAAMICLLVLNVSDSEATVAGKILSLAEIDMAENLRRQPPIGPQYMPLMPPSPGLDPPRRLSEQSDPPRFDAAGNARRNEPQADKRKGLDNYRCIITKQEFPDACHIIGYSVNKSERNRARLEAWLPMATRFFFSENLVQICSDVRHVFTSSVGASDRAWNMLSLNPTLHDWWTRGCFGLKWLGSTTLLSADPDEIATIRLQFQWMMWRVRPVGAKKPNTDLGRTVEDIQAAFPEYSTSATPHCGNAALPDPNPLIAMCRPATGWNIENGEVFEVQVQQKHMMKMKLAVNLQWAFVQLIAMAGGADAMDDLPDDPEFLDEDGSFPVVAENRRAMLAEPPAAPNDWADDDNASDPGST